MCKTAIVLAGGFGERLKNLTATLPKSLLPIGDTPLLEIILRQLSQAGFQRVILAIGHLGDSIRSFCKDGSRWNLSIEYSEEKVPLGTIGPIKLIADLPDNFLIMNSDILTDLNFSRFYDQHVQEKNLFTIAAVEQTEEFPYGVLKINHGHLDKFIEKPLLKQTVNMGVYMAHRKILDSIPDHTFYGIHHLLLKLLDSNTPIAVIQHRGTWMDVGTLKQYHHAQSGL